VETWTHRASAIWGLSYGGVLTHEALARNSDLFVAAVSTWPACTSGETRSTPTTFHTSRRPSSAIDSWKSPVLIWQGDDDRNVEFSSQTIGLSICCARARLYFELNVVPGRHP